mmetsp:Transcript_17725/g.41223  ORF Transcript_17725/g.41223 Transcript_17725/m.41223 type:complete len:534 (+) Transcript_17725:42-1643(+)
MDTAVPEFSENVHAEASLASDEDGLPLAIAAAVALVAFTAWWFLGGSGRSTVAPVAADAAELRRLRLAALSKTTAPSEHTSTADNTPAAGAQVSQVKAEAKSAAKPPTEPKNSAEVQAKKSTSDRATSSSESSAPRTLVEGVASPKTDKQEKHVEAAPASADSSTPKEQKPAPAPAPKEEPSSFEVRIRVAVQGSSTAKQVQVLECSGAMTLRELRDRALQDVVDASKARLFFKGAELRDLTLSLQRLGIGAGAMVQVSLPGSPHEEDIFRGPPAGADTSKSRSAPSATSRAPAAVAVSVPSEPFSLRAQGTFKGSSAAHTLEKLDATMTVVDLEEIVADVFASGDERLRLFYMGRELRDAEATLGAAGLKPGATVQVMFVPGQQRRRSTNRPVRPEEIPTTSALDGGDAGAVPAQLAGVGASDAQQTGTASSPPQESEPSSPAEAWSAMANLEEQLSRASDTSEEVTVRQSAQMLRQMLGGILATLTQEDNPALLQTAQALVPDLAVIWAYEPTRERLLHLVNTPEATADAA